MSESDPKLNLPELPGTTLELHWADFRRLLERRAQALPPPAQEAPPVAFALGAARVTGEVVAGEHAHARLTAAFDVSLLAQGWQKVPLLEGELALRSARVDGADVAVDPEDTSPLQALLKGPGQYRVELDFVVPLLTDADQSAFEFTLPAAPVVNLEVSIPRTRIAAEVSPAVSTTSREEAGATVVVASVPAGETARLAWTKAREVVRETPAEPPQLFARSETFVGVGDGVCRATSTVNLTVLKAAVRTLSLEVPADATVAELTGPQVASWEARPGATGAQTVRVELKGDFKGTTAITLEVERPYDATPPIRLPLPRALGVERETGFVAVAATTTIELAAAEAPGLTRVDVKELPPSLTTQPHPVVLAYKFRQGGGSLSLTAQRHAELPVVTGMADIAEHTVLQTADGKRVSRATYRVRNSQRQFLRLRLPAGATVWSTLLDGAAVKPASGEAGEVLIPLRKARSHQDAEQPFEVEVVTMAEAGALSEKGRLKVELPSCDLPVGALRLSLWVPEGYLYDDFTGPLDEVRGFRDPWSPEGTISQAMQHITPPKEAPPPPRELPRAPPPPPPPMAPPMVQAAASMPMPQGQPGYGGIGGMPLPPASPAKRALQEKGGPSGKKLAKEMDRRRESRMDSMDDEAEEVLEEPPEPPADEPYIETRREAPRDAGVLPVRMSVPEKGLCFAFERLLVLDEPLFVETEYAREKLVR